MPSLKLWAAMAAAGLLSACGGGGGDAGSSETPGSNANASAAVVAINGTAAKGLMANALVTAHAVRSDGTAETAALASARTDAQGKYTLTVNATKDQPFVIKVSAEAGTTHLDEVTGQAQALPVGFTMRALMTPTSTGSISTNLSVTPFSEMAVAAAAKASGGLTAANAAQANTAVTQLLGFNPAEVGATTVAAASNPNEQKLALMLTAVSQMAGSSALGCASGSAGDKVQCVVGKLSASASTTSIKLQGSDGADVSGALLSAVQTVASNPQLSGAIPPSLVAGITTNLGCSGNACTPTSSSGGTADPVAVGITAAKALFTEIKTDWTTMFSKGGVSALATGAVNAQAWKFRQAMEDVQQPAELLIKDATALLTAVDLYNDFKSGRSTLNSRGGGADLTANPGPSNDFYGGFNTVACSIYQDSGTTQLSTAPDNANFLGCRAVFYVERAQTAAGTSVTEWRHGFTLTPNADGSFSYSSRARKRSSSNGVVTENLALQEAAPYTGKLVPTLAAPLGRVLGFSIEGQLPGAFKSGGTALVDAYQSWNLSGTREVDAQGMSKISLSGSIASFNADASKRGTLTLKSGSAKEIQVSRDQFGNEVKPGSASAVASFGGTLSEFALNLQWATAGAEFEGEFLVGESVWDKSGTSLAPTRVKLAGALRNIVDSKAQEFLSGAMELKLQGHEGYDDTLPLSADNSFSTTLSFVGKASAPSRPVLDAAISVTAKAHAADRADGSLQYKSLIGDKPRTAITITASHAADGSLGATLTEAASGLSLQLKDGVDSADLMIGATKIGVLSQRSKGVTFSNGEFMSIEFGL